MTEGEGLRIGDDNHDEEPEERRRSRLWLGYSEDNLRSPRSTVGGQPQPQDEELGLDPVASLSISNDGTQDFDAFSRHTLRGSASCERAQLPAPNKPTSNSKVSISHDPPCNNEEQLVRGVAAPSRLNRQLRDSRAYDVPANYRNLDELEAPSPIKDPRKDREQGYLEDRDDNTLEDADGVPSDFGNLNEVADPAPVERTEKEDTNGKLEDHKTDGLAKDGNPHENESLTKRQRASKLAIEVYTVSYLIFFSILGTLARLGLQALTFYPGAPVQTGLLWCNVGGSLIMGFLSEDRKLFRKEWCTKPQDNDKEDHEEQAKRRLRSESASKQHAAVKKTLPLYIGLATGFCGSFTSFSSFMRDAFFSLSNALPVPINHPSSAPISPTVNVQRNPGYSFLAVLAILITTIGLSLMAILFGAHVALFLEPFTPSIPSLFARKVIDRSVFILAFGCWLAAILMAIWPPDRPGGPVGDASWAQETWRSQALLALVFAPPGCLLRFYISLHLNGRVKAFPLGTFAVNIFGTIVEAVFLDLQRVPIGGMVGCQVLQGMSDGFCGCLTTVSTWVAELTALRIKHAYFYGMLSVVIALSFLVIITGSLQWTKGFTHPLCTA